MEPSPSLPPSETASALHEFAFNHQISPTAAKVVELAPHLIFGSSKLFNYDPTTHLVTLAPSFKDLLSLLIDLETEKLDPSVVKAESLDELNSIFQKTQVQGGLLRLPTLERPDLEDSEEKKAHQATIDSLFEKLGFKSAVPIIDQITVDHCFIFGAMLMRVETRIKETLNYLKNNLTVTGSIILLGSDRKLREEEKAFLKDKIATLKTDDRKDFWTAAFAKEENLIESNGFTFLWELLTSQEEVVKEIKVISQKSTTIGYSYSDTEGNRATTETTIEDWLKSYKEGVSQSIFAVVEMPFVRLSDQLRATVLSKAQNLADLTNRVARTIFHFATIEPSKKPLINVVLDEIGRNVYRTRQMLSYVDKLASDE